MRLILIFLKYFLRTAARFFKNEKIKTFFYKRSGTKITNSCTFCFKNNMCNFFQILCFCVFFDVYTSCNFSEKTQPFRHNSCIWMFYEPVRAFFLQNMLQHVFFQVAHFFSNFQKFYKKKFFFTKICAQTVVSSVPNTCKKCRKKKCISRVFLPLIQEILNILRAPARLYKRCRISYKH